MEDKVKNYYLDPKNPGSFSGINSFSKSLADKKIKINKGDLESILLEQDSYSLHRPIKKRFKRNQVIVSGIDDTWQADLVDVSSISKQNNGIKFLLTCIDIFSKFAWIVPLTNKSGSTITKAFQIILKDRFPKRLQTDKGKEFLNLEFQSFLKKQNIKFYTTNSDLKASVCERFNRTIKEKMWRYFTHKNNYRYFDILQDLVESYNNTYHRTIKMSPIKVNIKNENNLWFKMYGYTKELGDETHIIPKFNINDKVRISKYKKTFDKGYIPNWTREIFIIKNVLIRSPVVYIIKDLNDEEIEGTFYEQELQKIYKFDEIYKIDEILETKIIKRKKHFLVSWLGYPSSFNSWIKEDDFKK